MAILVSEPGGVENCNATQMTIHTVLTVHTANAPIPPLPFKRTIWATPVESKTQPCGCWFQGDPPCAKENLVFSFNNLRYQTYKYVRRVWLEDIGDGSVRAKVVHDFRGLL